MNSYSESMWGVVWAVVQNLRPNTVLVFVSLTVFSVLLLVPSIYPRQAKAPNAQLLPGPKG